MIVTYERSVERAVLMPNEIETDRNGGRSEQWENAEDDARNRMRTGTQEPPGRA